MATVWTPLLESDAGGLTSGVELERPGKPLRALAGPPPLQITRSLTASSRHHSMHFKGKGKSWNARHVGNQPVGRDGPRLPMGSVGQILAVNAGHGAGSRTKFPRATVDSHAHVAKGACRWAAEPPLMENVVLLGRRFHLRSTFKCPQTGEHGSSGSWGTKLQAQIRGKAGGAVARVTQ